MGVRQGSVEGPACFLALYNVATWEVKTAGDRKALTVQQEAFHPVVNVSDLEFMDDLASFFEFHDLDALQRFIECDSAAFTQHSFQVNVGKLEVCAVVAGPRSQSRVAQLKQGHFQAKYLDSILHVGANNKELLPNRVTQASAVRGRLTPRVWRSSSIPLPLKIRLWQTLVLTKGKMANQEAEAPGTQSSVHHKGDQRSSSPQSPHPDDREPAAGSTSQMVEATSLPAVLCRHA